MWASRYISKQIGHRNSESLSTNEPGTPVKIPGTRDIEFAPCPCKGWFFRLWRRVEVFEGLEISPELLFPAEVDGWLNELLLYDNCESFVVADEELEDLEDPPPWLDDIMTGGTLH